MQVKILETDERLGVIAGEVYEAKRYRYDPAKMELISRVPDGYDPCCNQYMEDVAHMIKGKWHRIINGTYQKEQP